MPAGRGQKARHDLAQLDQLPFLAFGKRPKALGVRSSLAASILPPSGR
jgi:hypothetical protein